MLITELMFWYYSTVLLLEYNGVIWLVLRVQEENEQKTMFLSQHWVNINFIMESMFAYGAYEVQ